MSPPQQVVAVLVFRATRSHPKLLVLGVAQQSLRRNLLGSFREMLPFAPRLFLLEMAV